MRAKRPAKVVPAAKPKPGTVPDAALAALLFGVTFLAYLPAMNGGMLIDDVDHITAPALQSLHGLWAIWFKIGATAQYWPLMHTAFWLEHKLWGDAFLGYHLVNVLLHATAACLLIAVVRRRELPGAWLAGFLWALHPVAVQSVAWMSEQKNTLSTVFYLASALLYLHFDRTRQRRVYFQALALFVMALLTKSVTATLPAALLVVFWWRRGRLSLKSDVLPLVPWFGIALASGLVTAWVEQRFIGAAGADFSLSFIARCLLAARVVWFYFAKLLLPFNLLFYYPRWQIDAAVWWQWLPLVGVLLAAAAGVWLARRGRRGPLAALLLFGGTLVSVLGFLNVYPFLFSFVADHFQYLASQVVAVAAACVLTVALRRFPASARLALPVALAVLLGVLSFRQSALYRDGETLYRHSIAHNPDSWAAHNNLGIALSEEPGRMPEAIREFQESLRIRPNNLGAHYNLASALAETDRAAEAIAEYEAALRIDPSYMDAHYNLALLLLKVPGRDPEAIQHLETVLRLKPDLAPAYANLGAALAGMMGRAPDAVAHLQTALRLDPNLLEAHYTLGSLFSKMPDRLADAIAEFQAAIRLNPDFAEAHYRLGLALAQLPGRRAEAVQHLETASRLRPDVEEVRAALVRVRSMADQNRR